MSGTQTTLSTTALSVVDSWDQWFIAILSKDVSCDMIAPWQGTGHIAAVHQAEQSTNQIAGPLCVAAL